MKKVLIALPTSETIHHKVVGTLCAIILNNTKYEIDTMVSAMSGIGEHRNVLVKEFLNGDYDYLLMIDADNPPPLNVLDLIDLDLEVIGLPTPINMSYIQGVTEIKWNVSVNKMPCSLQGTGLTQIPVGEWVGSGVMLIRRDVLEKVKHPFTTVRDEEDMRTVGTDAAFCQRCHDNGVKIWTHWDFKCSHYKTINIATL